jgi:hypothetical protein
MRHERRSAGRTRRLVASGVEILDPARGWRDERTEGPELAGEAVARAPAAIDYCRSGAPAAIDYCRSGAPAATPPVRLILNAPPELAAQLGMAGVHLTSSALMALDKRPLSENFLIGASCHSPTELARAAAIGADFACLSPVRYVKGYTEDEILGLERFAEHVRECSIPVYALGGMRREDLPDVREAGGQGIAGISAFWPAST